MIKLIISLLLTAVSFSAFAEGITLGATRLIYSAGKKEASIPVITTGDAGPFLIQSWVSNMDKTTGSIPFITTPPLFKIGRNDEASVRVVDIGNTLPSDRESVFLLNVRAVPAVKKEANPERMIIATQNIIKLIYRPATLNSQGAEKAINQLDVSLTRHAVKIKNPTPYAVTLVNLTVDTQHVNRPGVIMPFAELMVPLNNVPQHAKISFATINDFGGLTETRQVNL
ncbi:MULTISPECIES: fimbrial biogenesis chaperone [Tenebrionibacter/Tenebrionicola group]|jgi:fimbrial chaperone protein|uniref:Molecular chaperone n=2 Tax=Tenebrionibacter/Tenebrionicola group TaxID=2969848 RepID=A0A8K0V8N8_9ENTR|nr:MULTISPECIES: molecular chaperone [Tenebrionibacter/Tenebrionicola group]MBK4716954.1 molecular chaperone [Tenebrionibacter intestinalis]MBV4412789.1 molecular chaperone [Tenebrionicola larvae]MBV5097494.1 molecular chaperone [Tenebrionicola larvae]